MRDHVVVDDFGRRTVFRGEKLVAESTDTVAGQLTLDELQRKIQQGANAMQVLREAGIKPQWLDVTVWRTAGGSFVVERTTHYRVRHTSDMCTRAEGYELIPATSLDTYPCPTCNKDGILEGGCAQADRINVDAYTTPQELIQSFQQDGRYSNLARTILADLSEQDERIDELWNTVVVP